MESLFGQQDSQEFLDQCYSLLMAEADRGCILLGVSMLDEELTKFFKSILPSGTSRGREKDIFDGRGAFGSLSAKLDIAYVCQLLPGDLVDCIHHLRKLRNNLAHKVSPFTIEENLGSIFDVFNRTSGNLPAGMAHLSGEVVYQSFLRKLMDTDHPTEAGKKLFGSQGEAIAYLNENDEIKTALVQQRIKTMFVIGIATLAALIIFHREKVKTKKLNEQ